MPKTPVRGEARSVESGGMAAESKRIVRDISRS